MYPKYFGLAEPSFSIAPDPHYLYLSGQHKEALAHLLYGAGESGGFVLLTGEVGTGKTTVCRAFLEQLPEGVDVALILNPAVTANELLLEICRELHIETPEGERSVKLLVDCLNRYLLDAHARGRRPVVMIDEAQNLRPKVLEQIRLLTNLETTKHKLLQIFLIGQPELKRMLARPSLRQLDQRITARFHLRPLSAAETADYIRHRVAVAGVDRPLFTPAAIRRIHRVSGGVPRLVNILCDRALLGACVNRASQVSADIVARAAREVRGDDRASPPPERPAVRPAFAVAATVTLTLVAGWMGWSALVEDPGAQAAAWLAGLKTGLAAETGPAAERVAAGASDGVGNEPAGGPAALADADGPGSSPDPAETVLVGYASGGGAEAPPAAGAPDDLALDPAGEGEGPESAPVAGVPEPAPSAVAASGPEAPAPAGNPVSPPISPPVSPTEELPRLALASFAPESAPETLARLGLPEARALAVLLRRWGVTLAEPERDLRRDDPCADLPALGLRCEREQGRLSHVRFFDRPVLLRLPPDLDGAPRYAALGALDAEHATLDLEWGSELVPIAGLESVWTGDYTVVWQIPPTGAALIGPGASPDSVRWLRRLLADTPGSGVAYLDSGRFDATLSGAVREFQRARGLAADGLVGPRTLIQLRNAADTSGIPRLGTARLAGPAPSGADSGPGLAGRGAAPLLAPSIR